MGRVVKFLAILLHPSWWCTSSLTTSKRSLACHCGVDGALSLRTGIIIPMLFLKSKADIVIASVRSSVRLSVMLFLLNHRAKFNQLWCVWVTHINGACNVNLFWPRPLGPSGGGKGQVWFKFNYKVNFKDFLYETLCVFSQIKDTKHIR